MGVCAAHVRFGGKSGHRDGRKHFLTGCAAELGGEHRLLYAQR